MLGRHEITEYEILKAKAMSLLEDNESLSVIDQALYLRKDGGWDARFGMSGYSLGTPSIEELLKAYVLAVSGVEATDDQVENSGPLILRYLIDSLRQAVQSNQYQLVASLIMKHLASSCKDDSILKQIGQIGGEHDASCSSRQAFSTCNCGIKEAGWYYDLVKFRR